MPEHDPLKFVTGLGAKLATRSRHVCAFLGAGTARACGLPDVAQLQERVLGDLKGNDKKMLSQQLVGRNLEQALTRLRRITALLTGEKTLDDLTATQAKELDVKVCQAIVTALDIQAADLTPAKYFAAWVARTSYHLPLELFTVNYDLLLETALEHLRVPYFDGFVGHLRARFQTELVEAVPEADKECVPAFFVRLWKLHGSVNWTREQDEQIVRLGQPVATGDAAAIYPSDTKYEESRRVPFVVLQDRLRRALHLPETLVLVSGYSFNDDHLNEMLFDAATRRARSEIIAFCNPDIPEKLVQRATATPNLQAVSESEAILGGIRAKWKVPKEAPPDLWADGKFTLCDFKNLAKFLARSGTREPEDDAVLRELLAKVIGKNDQAAGGKGNG